jgi:DNA-binding MarR family transcriptional regulator
MASSTAITVAASSGTGGAAPERGPGAEADEHGTADLLLAQTARIRRAGRRRSGRPAELSLLTGAQLELVRVVRRRPGISIADAAQKLSLAPNTVSTLVRQLTEAELVVRTADETDRRVARLELSPSISHRVAAWRDRRVLAVETAIASLSPDERRLLAEAVPVLARVAERLESPFPER